jgi:methylated-DNA-[protein]-cysteine S-methyltransferase
MRGTVHSIPLASHCFRAPCGWIGLAVSEQGLYEVVLETTQDALGNRMLRYGGQLDTAESRNLLASTEAALREYFRTPDCCFDLPLDLQGLSDFSVRVLSVLADVRCGQVISYGSLARRSGSPGAARAVGRVMAGNPFPIVVPCHRVLGAGGGMTGYSGGEGVATKLWLLRHERYSAV